MKKWGYQELFKITRDFHYFSESVHQKGSVIDKKFNEETKGCKRGQMTNMLFFESITKNFPTVYDVINEDESNTDKNIIPQFEKDVKYYDVKFTQDLIKFYKQFVSIKPNINKNTLMSYQYLSNLKEVYVKWLDNQSIINQMQTYIHKKYSKHNLTRTILNFTWSRTALYSERKYFGSKLNPEKLPYPLYTPFVFTTFEDKRNKKIRTLRTRTYSINLSLGIRIYTQRLEHS